MQNGGKTLVFAYWTGGGIPPSQVKPFFSIPSLYGRIYPSESVEQSQEQRESVSINPLYVIFSIISTESPSSTLGKSFLDYSS